MLALTTIIFTISELHSLLSSEGDIILGTNSIYLVILIGLIGLSTKHTQATAVLFTLTLITSSFLLLTLSDEIDAKKYAIISLYSLPLITRLLFSFRASLMAMAINICPFYLIISEYLAQTNTSSTPSFYFQLLTFFTLNLGLPLAVSRIIFTLENNAKQMQSLYQKLNDNYALYEEFFENTGTPTLLCDQYGKILKANQLSRELLTDNQVSNFSDSKISDWLSSVANNGKFFWQSNVAQCTLKNNPETHIEVRRATLDRHGHYVLHLQNTTELRAIQQELEYTQQTNSRLTHFDLLTRLPNYRNFCHQVNERINAKDTHLTGAMFIIRICQFKLLNKQYGKDNANRVILNFAKALQGNLSEQAIISRLRGVKFACFIPLNQTHLIQKNLTTLIRSVLPKQLTIDGNSLNMDYQVGIAYYQTDGKTAEILLEHCEMALEYSSSTDRFSYYNYDLENKLIGEHKLSLKLSSAIKNKEIKIWLQPQVAQNGQICSFEALARWKNGNQFISPTVFISIAEKLGLLPLLAENIIKELVSTLSEWHKEHIYTPIAFNLAGQELMNDSFFALLMNLISDKPWLSELLELEITETSYVMTNPLIHKRLRSLSQFGFSIAIDDFGTGQASLGQLVDIPANTLKIDRRFITPLPNDQRHIDIVKSTIQLAESLGMKVIAEGIETKEQANLLIALGCHTLQGYYFGKPSPLSDWTSKNNEKAKELRMVY
ncbi:bifunctional diguanylate cyclase/phosphodiesterase [Marinomonas sp. 5E14-1]|uniref:sensor domain-containing protein n=1 Tax=Marinomonas sp. 5E14-1 TaxID=3153922 RepID=UPI0032641844